MSETTDQVNPHEITFCRAEGGLQFYSTHPRKASLLKAKGFIPDEDKAIHGVALTLNLQYINSAGKVQTSNIRIIS